MLLLSYYLLTLPFTTTVVIPMLQNQHVQQLTLLSLQQKYKSSPKDSPIKHRNFRVRLRLEFRTRVKVTVIIRVSISINIRVRIRIRVKIKGLVFGL